MSVNKYLDYAGLQRLVENIDKKYAPIAALLFKGTVEDIAHLPALSGLKAGWMYNVTTGGGTTSDFIEGAGHVLGDGENVAVVELITGYTAVDPASVTPDKDPKALDWYESNGLVPPTYTPSTDRIADASKTYYTADTENKWDILGGVFDLEDAYLEFGTEFPQGPASRMVNGRTFLYMGEDSKVYTYVDSPSGRPSDNGYFEGTFTAVADPSTVINPKEAGLYEADAVVTGAYVHTSDLTPATGKTYYEGTFVASTDSSVDPSKFYYTEEDLYRKATIYTYDATNHDWVAQSSGGTGDLVPITTSEVDELFI